MLSSHQNLYTPTQSSVNQLDSPEQSVNVPRQHTRQPIQPKNFRFKDRRTAPYTSHFMNNNRTFTNNSGRSPNYNKYVSEKYNTYTKKVGCYNCGEFNHIQANYRFDHNIMCQQCHTLGHKSRLCNYYC